MPTLNVSLPEPLREYVEARAESGHYSSSEYIRQLIREDRDRQAAKERDQLWELLAIGEKQLDDGNRVVFDPDDVKARGRARHAAAAR